jgi:ankyrin repeat protein
LDVAVADHNADLARLLVDSGAKDISVHAAALIGDTVHLGTDTGIPSQAGPGPDADPLHLAAESGNPEAVAALLAQGADVHGKDRYGQTALHYAARGANTEIVDALIAKGANIEARDTLGRTPLHRAAEGEANNAIARLIELGANINARDSEGSTPLLIAALLNVSAETVRLLLECGADADIPRKSGLTPLAAAVENGHAASAEVLRQHSA